MKKLLAMLLATMLLVACAPALADEVVAYPEVVEGVDFGGQTVYIYDWWSNPARKAEPTEREQATYDYLDWLMETYNCKIVRDCDGTYSTISQQFINFCGAPDGSLRIYMIPSAYVGSAMSNNMYATWSDTDLINLADEKWNGSVLDFMSKGGKVYGVNVGNSEPRTLLYFNKRVLKDAGIDPESIYDMQAAGTWTWEAFEDIVAKLTRDTDNDGMVDIYGLTGNSNYMYQMGVFSNNGTFFDFNDEGKMEVTVDSNEAMEGLNWAKRMWTSYAYMQPEDGDANYYKDAFKAGFCGFCVHWAYAGFNDNNEFMDMADEYGAVAFPIGPKGDTYVTVVSDVVIVIPNVYDAETVGKLAFMYDMYTLPTPGYEDEEDAWTGNKYNYTDERAVDETYGMLREAEHCRTDNSVYVGQENDVLGAPLLWRLNWNDPGELVEAAMPVWQTLCDTFNGD